VFIDIVGSTAMKQKGISQWIALIHNAFSVSKSFLSTFSRPLKGIGDELMYFVEDADMQAAGETALLLYDALFQIAGAASLNVPSTKIVAAYCRSVYPITFLPGTRDYYGADVDRAARLKTVDPPLRDREVIIDDALQSQVMSEFRRIGNQAQFLSVGKLTGPCSFTAKGIPLPVTFYRAMA